MTASTHSISRHRPAGPGFEHRGRTPLPALDGALACYVHLPTGARHLHLDLPAEDCAFLMAFLTPAPDSSGLTHVLEHLVMCGSERYPCRRAFFSMLGRTLSTAMNALATEDCTACHFATRSLADYENLLSVYLDAAFFPRLDRLDFEQEGCRVEIEAAGEEGETPVRRGVVLSEMRGLMHDPEQQLRQALNRRLFPSGPYRFNAGGDPWRIPALDYEALRAYHRRHYHPGNAVFLSAGTLRPEWLHARLEALALARFPYRGSSSAPPPAWEEPVLPHPPAGWSGTPADPHDGIAKRPRERSPLASLEAPPLEAPSRSVVRYPTVSVTGMADRKPVGRADASGRGLADATDTADRGPAGAADAADREPAGAADAADREPAGAADVTGRRPAGVADAADMEDRGRTDAGVALAWRLGDTSDPVAVVRARLLACCLLEQGNAPLRRALEAPGSPAAALASNGVQVTRRRIVFQCGVHGCDPDLAGEIETRVLAAVADAARDGLDEAQVDGALARIERELRERHDPRYPFPLDLLTRILPAALYGGEPAAALDAPRALAALRAETRSRKDTAELVRRYLRDNPERVTVTAVPDPAAARRLDAEDRALLEREYGGPAHRQARDRVIERARMLRRRQRSRAGESSLPKIGLDAIGPPREPPELLMLPAGGPPARAAHEAAVGTEAGPLEEATGDRPALQRAAVPVGTEAGPLEEATGGPAAGVGRGSAEETTKRRRTGRCMIPDFSPGHEGGGAAAAVGSASAAGGWWELRDRRSRERSARMAQPRPHRRAGLRAARHRRARLEPRAARRRGIALRDPAGIGSRRPRARRDPGADRPRLRPPCGDALAPGSRRPRLGRRRLRTPPIPAHAESGASGFERHPARTHPARALPDPSPPARTLPARALPDSAPPARMHPIPAPPDSAPPVRTLPIPAPPDPSPPARTLPIPAHPARTLPASPRPG